MRLPRFLRRYRFRRLAWLRSMPLSSAPNSCAVISRRASSSARTASRTCLPPAAWPTPRTRRDPNIKSSPGLAAGSRTRTDGRRNASSFIAPVTSACSPSKLRRMSHGEVHKYTRTLAGRWITRFPQHASTNLSVAASMPTECEAVHLAMINSTGRPPPSTTGFVSTSANFTGTCSASRLRH